MLKYIDETGDTISDVMPDGRVVVLDRGDPLFDEWVTRGPAPFTPPKPPSHAEILKAERAQMQCTRRQARIVLGQDTCAALDALADDTETPWAMRQTLLYAQTWERTAPEIDEIGWALGYDAEQIDALFRAASKI